MTATRGFQLAGPPTLSRSTVDRAEPARDDPDRLAALWAHGRLLSVDQAGRAPVAAGSGALVYADPATVGPTAPPDAVLLGEQDGVGYWAVRRDRGTDDVPAAWRVWDEPEPDGQQRWLDLRAVGASLNATDAGLLTTAVAVLNWHRQGGFCARCGAPVRIGRAGWATHCTGCGREEYPRTDPAVICLVHDEAGANGEHVLLARQPSWPPDRYSVLAGFVEAGESLEDCVRREIAEEVGLAVRQVRYLGNQPWPFPRSLMVGFTAVADRTAPLRLVDGEIADARWVSRAEVRAALAADGVGTGFRLPGTVSIAQRMIESWALAD